MTKDLIVERYINGEYSKLNPEWDINDSPWKAQLVIKMLHRYSISPKSIVEIGCGAGAVLKDIRREFPDLKIYGFDIAPSLERLWNDYQEFEIIFSLNNFFDSNLEPDLVLVLDVLEHLADPFAFLYDLSSRCNYAIFHIPLDLSAINILRETPLLHVRRKMGHIHYYTRQLAIEMLHECGFEIIDARYTNASNNIPDRAIKTRFAGFVRFIFSKLLGNFGVRMLGGETLIVLAKPKTLA